MAGRDPFARISKSGNSWRVRLHGYPHASFSPTEYGSQEAALEAARAWRDARWDGEDRKGAAKRKLTDEQVAEIRASDEHYVTVAQRYGISPNYVHYLRRKR